MATAPSDAPWITAVQSLGPQELNSTCWAPAAAAAAAPVLCCTALSWMGVPWPWTNRSPLKTETPHTRNSWPVEHNAPGRLLRGTVDATPNRPHPLTARMPVTFLTRTSGAPRASSNGRCGTRCHLACSVSHVHRGPAFSSSKVPRIIASQTLHVLT